MPGLETYNAEDMANVLCTPYFSCSGERFGNFETEGEDFSHGAFDQGTFTTITFDNCDFANASFEKAELKYICFIDCDFTNANFDSAHLEECSFINCGLSQSSFQNGTLINITITESQGPIDFADAELVGGVVYETNLTKSSFHNTTLEGVVFGKCTMTDLFMSHKTSFSAVTLSGCDITDVYFVMADGGDSIEYKDCIYMPYLQELRYKGSGGLYPRQRPPKLNVHHAPHVSYGWNESAELVCSSMAEYREVV